MTNLKAKIKEPYIVVNGRKIGIDYPTYIIGEIGINHNGSVEIAKYLIDLCLKYGADCVKFQLRNFEDLYLQDILENPTLYDQQIYYTIYAQKRAMLSIRDLKFLKEYAENNGLTFLCTPFDKKSVDVLEDLEISAYKIGSPDLTNFPLLKYTCSKKKPILLSTGMSTYSEIEKTVTFLKSQKIDFCLLHCNSTYPAMDEDIHLNFIKTLKKFGVPVGYSGHERGLAISLAATLYGACIIERHITLDRTMVGPDHAASLGPEGFRRLIRDIKVIKKASGYEKRYISRGEYFNRNILGKSLVTTCTIKKGDIFTEDMISAKSPAKGISPQYYFDFLGKSAIRNFKLDDYLKLSDIGEVIKDFSLNPCYNWGFIVRFSDYKNYFPFKPKIFEFHFTDQDLFTNLDDFFSGPIDAALAVHAPTNWDDDVLDISSDNQMLQSRSIESIINTIDITRQMSKYFNKQKDKPIKMVLHAPGISRFERIMDNEHLYKNLHDSIQSIDFNGIELLLENLGPFGWYYGGQGFNNIFYNPQEILEFLEKEKLKMTFDTSHAGMYVNSMDKNKITVHQFYNKIKHLVRHVHVADAIGVLGEGLQIGEGIIDFNDFLPELIKTNVTYLPEIWLGHNHGGRGFRKAINKITEIVMK